MRNITINGNDPGYVRKQLAIYAKKKEGIGYMTRMWNAFHQASPLPPTHEMFLHDKSKTKLVKSCKGISMIITILGQKGSGLKWSECRSDEDRDTCKHYESEATSRINSMFYYCVENDIHFNFDLMLAFLYRYEKGIDEEGFGSHIFNKILNMIPLLGFESHLFFAQYQDSTYLNFEGPTDERRDGSRAQHTNEWNRLKGVIRTRKNTTLPPQVDPLF